ncbi:MAG: glycosyltransferase, partial [Rhodoglobus sp.]
KALADAGIHYRGPYSGGLAALPTHDYHALLLTSESEGLPLVLVQSMLLGLPVIATAVGGVTDIVQDNETGLLVSSPDDAEGFVRAITQLMDSLEDRQRIIHAAYDFAAAQHGWGHFTELVETLY